MAEIINLNRHRKARDRVENRATAARNRGINALSSVERAIAKAEERRARDGLDGKRLESDPPPGKGR